jgi:hypothetical protein
MLGLFRYNKNNVDMGRCHYRMARPHFEDGGDDLWIWRMAANILNKQSRTDGKACSCGLGLGRGVTPYREKDQGLGLA